MALCSRPFQTLHGRRHQPADARPRLKAVVATGNGTAGAFVPHVLKSIGCEVVPLHTELDHSFPHCNPDPELLEMLHDLAAAVTQAGADIGFAFDGDGDRCGVVDHRGREIFSDKIGVLLARDFVAGTPTPVSTDLHRHGANTEYWKTGHSYIKRRVAELGALAGFERSGHFFFNPPLGRGYDAAWWPRSQSGICLIAALSVPWPHSNGLPRTWASPTLSVDCPDEVKYQVADRVRRQIERIADAGDAVAGHTIADLVTVNGIRLVADDGT